MPIRPVIVWFRRDLRLHDNPALHAAVQSGAPVVPLYTWAPDEESPWQPGAASRWWLHHSLAALDARLQQLGSRLLFLKGGSLESLLSVADATGAGAVYWNRCYEPAAQVIEQGVHAGLTGLGLAVETFNASLLSRPGSVLNSSGGPMQVFTPFWAACSANLADPGCLPAPAALPPVPVPSRCVGLEDLALFPAVDWAGGMRQAWQPGEAGAQVALERFVEEGMARYPDERDRPDLPAVSRLAPHLHFGEIGPRQVRRAVADRVAIAPQEAPAAAAFIRQLGWREFAHHLLHHFPNTPTTELREPYSAFPWNEDPVALRAWQRGRTGYPLVDAGMRELWTTGAMHNRVRMVVGSFLVKDLLIDWRRGAEWFWDALVDADLANNTLGWQWVAGCGADAAPYFRIFNPVKQGEKFDPEGDYVRRWVPELAGLPAEWIHRPWEAPPLALAAAGVALGETYPWPIVDHSLARTRALAALAIIRKGG